MSHLPSGSTCTATQVLACQNDAPRFGEVPFSDFFGDFLGLSSVTVGHDAHFLVMLGSSQIEFLSLPVSAKQNTSQQVQGFSLRWCCRGLSLGLYTFGTAAGGGVVRVEQRGSGPPGQVGALEEGGEGRRATHANAIPLKPKHRVAEWFLW